MKVPYISSRVKLAALAALALVAALPATAAAQDRPTMAMDGQWHFAVAPYFWFSGVKGDVSVRNLPEVPIEKSFSDIWSDFQIGALAHFEGRKDRWGFATDMMYMDLRAPVAAGAPRPEPARRLGHGEELHRARGSASTARRAAGARTTRPSSTCWPASATTRRAAS